jgi:hypothetical protein
VEQHPTHTYDFSPDIVITARAADSSAARRISGSGEARHGRERGLRWQSVATRIVRVAAAGKIRMTTWLRSQPIVVSSRSSRRARLRTLRDESVRNAVSCERERALMVRMFSVILTVAAAGGGLWAMRRSAATDLLSSNVRSAVSQSRYPIPSVAPMAPPQRVADPMTPDLEFTVAVEVTARGKTQYALARMSTDDQVLVMGPDGRVPVFPTEEAARAWGAQFLPSRGSPEEQAQMDSLAAIYVGTRVRADLDHAYAWAVAPSPDGLGPVALTRTWLVLSLSGELPEAPPGDPMTLAMANEGGARKLSPDEELGLSLMKASLIVSITARQHELDVSMKWPEGAEMWSQGDAVRVAGAMKPAIPALVARLTTDVDAVALALSGRK